MEMSEFTRRNRRFPLMCALLLCTCVTSSAQAAELRTWTAASGGFTVEAELITVKPGDIAQLKTKDGRTLDVPLAQLSAADREYAKKQQAPAAPTSATPGAALDFASGTARFQEIQKQADRCRTPDEAMILFKVFHDDTATTAADRELAQARITEYKQLAAEKKVRLNKKWVSAEEAETVRKKADELMRQGLELWKLDQEDGARRKFTEASSLEPEEIRAEFILGFIYTLRREAEKALPIFQRCLQRDPDNVVVLNNIALLSASRGDWPTTVAYWRKAMAKQPDQRIVHNVGRFLSQAVSANVPVPKAPRESLALPYSELVASGKFKSTDPEVGWLLLLIEESDLDFSFKGDDGEKAEKKKVAVPEANDDGVVVGGGTGFVVHPGYVMTNAHVATDDAVFEIQTSDGKRLRGTRVSKSHDADLALIKCEELTAPPLVLAKDVAPRGTDVMVLGFPEFYSLGATLKATRGSISSVPDPKVEEIYLYDAVTNSGNSGGPVCDSSGNVVAVHFASMNTASRYGCGVPATKARSFLVQALSNDVQLVSPSTEKLEWPAVDAKVSPSTVLVWVRQKNAVAKKSSVGGDVLELPICLFCGGKKGLRCVAPGCAKMRAASGRSNCRNCNGSGLVKCQVCDGLGVDIQLASVQDAVKAAIAAKGGSASSSTSSPATTTGSNSSASGSSIDAAISPGFLQELRKNAKPGVPDSLSLGELEAWLGHDAGLLEKPTQDLTDGDANLIATGLRGNAEQAAESAKRLSSFRPNPGYRAQFAPMLESWIVNKPKQWKVKTFACRALTNWGRPESRPLIHELLRDEAWMVRRQAANTIAHTNDASGAGPLVECLLRPGDFPGDHDPKQFNAHTDRGRYMRSLIVLGEAATSDLKRVRPQQNAKVQEMIDFTIAACSEK